MAQSEWLLTMPLRYAELINAGLPNRLLALPVSLPPVSLNLYWSRQVENQAGHAWLREQMLALASSRG